MVERIGTRTRGDRHARRARRRRARGGDRKRSVPPRERRRSTRSPRATGAQKCRCTRWHAANAPRCATRLRSGTHVPHPRIRTASGRRIEAQAMGVVPAGRGRRRGARERDRSRGGGGAGGLYARGLSPAARAVRGQPREAAGPPRAGGPPIPSPIRGDGGGSSERVPRGAVHRRRGSRPPPVLHQPRPSGLRRGQPPRGGQRRACSRATRGADKSLRRLFLDEFVADLDLTGDLTVDATVGLKRAEALYERVFLEYGDDSVAQLGGVHLACEQASNILTKILEWGRLMSYLEQSTALHPVRRQARRPLPLLPRPCRARRPDPRLALHRRPRRLFDTYTGMLPQLLDWARERYPKDPADSDFVYKQSIRAKACDAARGILPAATLSNVGIYGTGQAFEALLLRMRAHPLPEARTYADDDARRAAQGHPVVPRARRPPGSWRRLERIPRGDAARDLRSSSHRLFGDAVPEPRPSVTLTDFDPDAEDKLLAAICYPHTPASRRPDPRRACARSARASGSSCSRAYVGERTNRRHQPGRAFERVDYRFDVLADYGAFRDLQRHRMLTIEWQPLYDRCTATKCRRPSTKRACAATFDDAMARSAALYEALVDPFPEQASYAVSLAYRMRFAMQMNAREAMHLLELRTTPSGHPAYRQVAPGDASSHRGAGRAPRDRGRDVATSTTPPTSSSVSPPNAPPTRRAAGT